MIHLAVLLAKRGVVIVFAFLLFRQESILLLLSFMKRETLKFILQRALSYTLP